MSEYFLTIYADPNGPVGHFSVGVAGPDGTNAVFGKYPKQDAGGKLPIGNVAGEIRNDAESRGGEPASITGKKVIRRKISITKDQAAKAKVYFDKARENPSKYNIFTDNCVDFAQGALDAAGAKIKVADKFEEGELRAMGTIGTAGGDAIAKARRDGRPQPALTAHNPIEGEIGGTEDQKPDSSDSDAEAKPQSQDINAGTDAGDDDIENASPENRKFMDNLLKPGNPVNEIMLKKPEDLTQGEFVELKKAMIDLPAGPEQERLDKAATAFLEHRYSTKPVKYDAVGRMIDPKPVNAIPETPKPLATADRKPLKYALRRIGRGILKAAKDDGLATTVKHLQGGINIMADSALKGAPIMPQLKQDGDIGPKTTGAFTNIASAMGPQPLTKRYGEFLGFL